MRRPALRLTFLCPLVLALLLGHLPAYAQQYLGFYMKPTVNHVQIPFQKYSNLITIPVNINGKITLQFILDTGAESTIFTEKILADLLGFDYLRQISLSGPGVMDSISATVASGVNISIGEALHGNNMTLLVLEEDYLQLSENLGEEVYGIIGNELFKRFIVSINYDDGLLDIYRKGTLRIRKSDVVIPIELFNNKPHITAIMSQNNEKDTMLFMVDTGASHAVLLDLSETEHLIIPEKKIDTRLGQGLGGVIPGFMARMDHFQIDKFDFDDILVSIPKSGAYSRAIKRGTKYGTIGGDVLSRFRVTFDYFNHRMILSKSESYKLPFEYNMSGMFIQSDKDDFNKVTVAHVRENSPADHVGIKTGDVILQINDLKPNMGASLSDFHVLLRKRDNKKIKVKIQRAEAKIKFEFRLQRLI